MFYYPGGFLIKSKKKKRYEKNLHYGKTFVTYASK